MCQKEIVVTCSRCSAKNIIEHRMSLKYYNFVTCCLNLILVINISFYLNRTRTEKKKACFVFFVLHFTCLRIRNFSAAIDIELRLLVIVVNVVATPIVAKTTRAVDQRIHFQNLQGLARHCICISICICVCICICICTACNALVEGVVHGIGDAVACSVLAVAGTTLAPLHDVDSQSRSYNADARNNTGDGPCREARAAGPRGGGRCFAAADVVQRGRQLSVSERTAVCAQQSEQRTVVECSLHCLQQALCGDFQNDSVVG